MSDAIILAHMKEVVLKEVVPRGSGSTSATRYLEIFRYKTDQEVLNLLPTVLNAVDDLFKNNYVK